MRFGLLWYDGDKRRSAQDKLDQAAARYAERFGRQPDTCQVNPAELFEHPTIRVVPSQAVLPGHFWVGEDEELAAARKAESRSRRRRKIA
jgi:hypothetical protein